MHLKTNRSDKRFDVLRPCDESEAPWPRQFREESSEGETALSRSVLQRVGAYLQLVPFTFFL